MTGWPTPTPSMSTSRAVNHYAIAANLMEGFVGDLVCAGVAAATHE